jgi:alpha-2-macroglobulin
MGASFGQFHAQQNESNDDTANRVLAASALRTVPQPVTGVSPTTYRTLSGVISAGVTRLMGKQYPDGGWPWFDAPEIWQSDPFTTADVVRALVASGDHRPSVRSAITRARAFLNGQLAQLSAAERAPILLVLAQSGGGTGPKIEALYHDSIHRSHLEAAPLADLGLALALIGDRRAAATVVADLDGSVKVSSTGAHWEGSGDYWSGPPIEDTADVLSVLLRLSPHDPLVPAAARWLMLARRGPGWDCSRDTAIAIAALAEYAHAAREGTAEYAYQVLLDGASRAVGAATPANTGSLSRTKVPVAQLPRTQPAQVVINRNAPDGSFGMGPLYYLARLHYYLPAAGITARDEGISVVRRYFNLRGQRISSVRVGSVVRVQLTITTSSSQLYLNLQDPLPSGCEAVDGSLATSQQGLFRPPPIWRYSARIQDLTMYLAHTDLRDNGVSLYAYYLPPGTYRYSYLMDATVRGRYGVSPTHVSETFFPEVFGRSAGSTFTVS